MIANLYLEQATDSEYGHQEWNKFDSSVLETFWPIQLDWYEEIYMEYGCDKF